MEITALCLRLVMNVLMLLVSQVQRGYCAQTSDSVFLLVDPNRLQHFEYESVSVTCEGPGGSSGWRVMRRINEKTKTCSTNLKMPEEPSCNIKNAYASDSGKYWCENEKRERSYAVDITITGGSVILESPALPVMEGDVVTLRCKTQMTLSNLTADFYKDGFLIRTGSTAENAIHSVSKSDEGLYKCNMSDLGESPESRLAVRASPKETPWIVGTIVIVTLLLVVGLLRFLKQRVAVRRSSQTPAPQSESAGEAQKEEEHPSCTVSREASEAYLQEAMYGVVTKPKKERGASMLPAETISSAATYQCLANEDEFYSLIQ